MNKEAFLSIYEITTPLTYDIVCGTLEIPVKLRKWVVRMCWWGNKYKKDWKSFGKFAKFAESLMTLSFWLGRRCFACKLQRDFCVVTALPIKPK